MKCDNCFMDYSVLMAVYFKESPLFLKESIDSILNQTFKTNDFVIVCDGRLPRELMDVLETAARCNNSIHLCGYEKNMGLGYALNFGLELCKNEIILRADSDDISKSNRAEAQIKKFLNDNVDLSSSTVALFENDPNKIVGKRALPLDYKKIIKFSKSRSPFNHPSVIFKKSKVMQVGGYKTLLYKEDYYLWIRMLISGCNVNNIPDELVCMRVNKNTFRKRKNRIAYANSKWLNGYMFKNKCINYFRYCYNGLIAFSRMYLPNFLVEFITKFYWKI